MKHILKADVRFLYNCDTLKLFLYIPGTVKVISSYKLFLNKLYNSF